MKSTPFAGTILASTSNDQQLSLTIKALLLALLPVIKSLLGIQIIGADADRFVDAIFTLATLGSAAYGYLRSKKILLGKLGKIS